MDDSIIDLDALQPQPVTLTFKGKTLTVNPPKTGDVLRLNTVARKINDLQGLLDEEIENILQNVQAKIAAVIPELKDENLNTAQLLLVIKIINEMALPPDAKELKKRGITVDNPKKVV